MRSPGEPATSRSRTELALRCPSSGSGIPYSESAVVKSPSCHSNAFWIASWRRSRVNGGRHLQPPPDRRLRAPQPHLDPVHSRGRAGRLPAPTCAPPRTPAAARPSPHHPQEGADVLDLIGVDGARLLREGPVEQLASIRRRVVLQVKSGGGRGPPALRAGAVRGVRDETVLHPAAEVVIDECGDRVPPTAVLEGENHRFLTADAVGVAEAPADLGGAQAGSTPASARRLTASSASVTPSSIRSAFAGTPAASSSARNHPVWVGSSRPPPSAGAVGASTSPCGRCCQTPQLDRRGWPVRGATVAIIRDVHHQRGRDGSRSPDPETPSAADRPRTAPETGPLDLGPP